MAVAVWKGTEAELLALLEAVTRDCRACAGLIKPWTCAEHRGWLESQLFLDHLLELRRRTPSDDDAG